MRRIQWLVVVAGVSMLALGGCKAKQGTPKELLEKMHAASEKMDAAVMLECMEPDAQAVMKDIVPLFEEMQNAMKDAAAAVEKKIGKDEAKPFEMMGSGKSDSPLKAVVKDGKIDWSKVAIKEEGDKATFEVDGKKADVDLKKVDGKWYVAMPVSERPTAEAAKKQAEQTRKMIDSVKELTKKVNDGKITKENFAEESGKVMSGM